MNDQPSDTSPIKPTKETYDGFQQTYEVLNIGLFNSELPNCLITLQRRKRTYGFFTGGQFGRKNGMAADEIALNPAHFRERAIENVFATLAKTPLRDHKLKRRNTVFQLPKSLGKSRHGHPVLIR